MGLPGTSPPGAAIYSSFLSQPLFRASCPLLHVRSDPEGGLHQAHLTLLEEPGLAGEGGTWTPDPPRQRQGVPLLAGPLLRCLGRGVNGWDWRVSWAVWPYTPQVLQGQKMCLLSPGLGLSPLRVGRWGRRPPLVPVVSGA